MKRLSVIVLALFMALSLAGCGEPKPNKELSENSVAALTAAIDTLDAFLAYNMSADEASDKLERIADSLNGETEFYDELARIYISNISTSLFCYELREGINNRKESIGLEATESLDMSEIREERNELYDFLYGK